MRRVGLTPDARAMTAVDYANISEDKSLQDLVSKVIGDKLLQVKPQSLVDVESRLEQSQISENTAKLSTGFQYSQKLGNTTMSQAPAPTLKPQEVEIFSK